MLFGLSTKALSAIAGSLVLIGTVFGTAAVLADDGDFGTIEAPAWQSGYAWNYDVTGAMDFTARVPGEPMFSESFDIPAIQIKKEILNTEDFSIDDDRLYLGATSLPLGHILDGSMFGIAEGGWQDLVVFPTADRHRDLAPVLAYPTYQQGATGATGIGVGPNTPIDYIEFPLQYGKRWTDSVELADAIVAMDDLDGLDGITEIKMVGEVGRMESIGLPVGTVDAVRLDFSYQPVGLEKAVAQMRSEAEMYGAEFERFNVQIGLHEIVHYSPEHQAVVRDQYILQVALDAAVSFGGESYEAFVEMSGYVLSELTGSSLVPTDEHTLQQILDIINGRESLPDLAGKVIEGSSLYRVDVRADRERVNAAEKEVVGFTVSHDAEGGLLPDGHSLQFVVTDAEGRVVDAGKASDSFSLRFDESGTYKVAVAAVDDRDRPVSIDKVPVYADFIQTVYASCSAYSNMFTADCGEVDVPTHAGLQTLVLEAQVNHTVMPLLFDGATYEDLAGRTHRASEDGNSYRLQFDGRDLPLGSGHGTFWYTPEIGYGEGVAYTIQAIYGPVGRVHDTVGDYDAGQMAVMQDWQLLGPVLSMMDDAIDGVLAQDLSPAPLSLF